MGVILYVLIDVLHLIKILLFCDWIFMFQKCKKSKKKKCRKNGVFNLKIKMPFFIVKTCRKTIKKHVRKLGKSLENT